jgi:hypothetical protein
MEAARKWHGLAVVGSIVALGAGTAALAPGASATSQPHSCANKPVTLKIEDGMGGTTNYKTTVKAISAQGVSCTSAYKFLVAYLNNKSKTLPEKYKCKIARFKAPLGYVPQVCTKSGVKLQFAQQGG